MKNRIIESIKTNKLVVIVRGVEKEKLIPLAEAMYSGGVRLMEITYSADGKMPDEIVAESINLLAEHFKNEMHIGAGTVLKKEQVILTKEAGGSFIISPDVFENVIQKTVELEMVSMPGALTPTEIQRAHRLGADFVKLFPVTGMGVEYLKAIMAPLSNKPIIAVGGINENNMTEYLKAGVAGFGVGSNIIDKKMITKDDYDSITNLAKKYVEVIKNA